MTSTQPVIRRFGSPGPGIEVLERNATNALADPNYGTAAMFGVLKRGPMGVAIPISGRKQYDEIFGDPKDSRWHLFSDGSHLTPDAIDGFFSNGLGYGTLWITRLDLDGSARKAEITLKGRHGADVLKIIAANEGRWGGQHNKIDPTTIVYATARTFTIIAPGVESNEFIGATAEFSPAPGKRYKIVANTKAAESGEVIFTVSAQYSLVSDGISGPVSIPGLASYSPTVNLSGSVSFSLLKDLTGTVSLNGRVVIGLGTSFVSDLSVGKSLYYDGEVRVIESISSDTTLTVSVPFTSVVNGIVLKIDNEELLGNATTFTSEIEVDDEIAVSVNGVDEYRRVKSILSDTSLLLESGFTSAIASNSPAKKRNDLITSTELNLPAYITSGDYIIDPNRQGKIIKVLSVGLSVNGLSSFVKIEQPLTLGFVDSQLVKQTQKVSINLPQEKNNGLVVEVGQGTRYPDTHFSLTVRFNGSLVVNEGDISLDPEDPLFVESLINDSNVAYRTGSQNYQKWITAECLWASAYTTSPGDDVRPCNGYGGILFIDHENLYTVADIDYSKTVGNLLFPSPYKYPRSYFRVKKSFAPTTLSGTISSIGNIVTGVGSIFRSEAKVGQYLYDENTKTAKKITRIVDNTTLYVETAFSSNIPALSTGKIAGYLQVDLGYDLTSAARDSKYFLVSFPQSLSRGYDGDTAHLMPYHLTKYADSDRNFLENAVFGRNMGLVRIATPGISDVSVQKAFAGYAEARAYEFRGEIPANYNTAATAESFINEQMGRNDFVTFAFPSYGFTTNPFGTGDRYISLSGDIMGGESHRASLAEGYHRVFAGVGANLSRIVKIPFEPMPSDEAILNLAGVQPVKPLSGNIVVFGARTPSASVAYDFTHIRRIQSNYVRVFLEARNLLELMFLPTQPELVEQIIMVLDNFARREYRKGVFSQYLNFDQAVSVNAGSLRGGSNQIVNDDTGRDALVEIINGKLSIYFSYVPTGILEKLSINCGPDILVANYGSTSNNISSL